MSSAGRQKNAGQRLTFYRQATRTNCIDRFAMQLSCCVLISIIYILYHSGTIFLEKHRQFFNSLETESVYIAKRVIVLNEFCWYNMIIYLVDYFVGWGIDNGSKTRSDIRAVCWYCGFNVSLSICHSNVWWSCMESSLAGFFSIYPSLVIFDNLHLK